MNSQGSKVKVFQSTALILSAVGFALYLLCYLLAGDGTDYFIKGHPLVLLANTLAVVSLLWFASALILIPRDTLPHGNFIEGKPCIPAVFPIIGSLGAGALSLTYFGPDDIVAILAHKRALDTTAFCAAFVALGVILSVVYYVLRAINTPNTEGVSVIMGLGPIALMTGLCGLTYFELDHHMNAPVKIALQLAFIATMVFMTGELRCMLHAMQPRRYLITACMALFANTCALAGAAHVLHNPTEAVHGISILGFTLLCLSNAVYIAYRLITFTKYCNPRQTQSEKFQEKEQQDGCQQQNPMASQEDN